ncbi:hypothetical protein RD792_014358 [Penstemon davidsonii]|uniref:RING-type domain-containing protein n=1 Tax=Penstemon davidsonii TaxID=160366 RepID=A0ABR0CRF9_9LAMI|nr:hypothetical protein RD792_014306 [Penstemon davidsonii]KAK4478853.1 hypothetical protein RD792_014358 [Penstemon davidsonii]
MNNNNTVADPGFLGSERTIGFSYGIGVSVAVLLLITTITLISYYCTRTTTTTAFVLPRTNPRGPPPPIDDRAVEVGLDEVTLRSYPKVLYSEVKLKNKDSTAACCSICLAGYKGSDIVRVLAECEHIFHMKCVDPWLRLHPTCPVCRTSPLPTPTSTPLVEVVPFATRPIG